jgi:hypothetical protein
VQQQKSNTQFKQPPIPFNVKNNIVETIASGQKFAGNTKKILEKLNEEHLVSL